MMLIQRQFTKMLEIEVENFNKNKSLFNLLKSKNQLNKSGSEISEKLLPNYSDHKRDLKKISSNADLDYFLNTAEYREKNFKQIREKAVYIQKINDDMNRLVYTQKVAIEKIADNIESSGKHSKDTFINLIELSEKNKLVRNKKFQIFMLIFAFCFFFTIFFINRMR
jgi:hypothetical protein